MPKRIKFEGSTHVFPDDFTDDDISGALGSLHPKPALSPVPGAAMTGTPKAGSAPAVDMNVWNPVRGMVPSSKMEPKPLPPSSWGNFKDTVASDITGIPKGMYNTVAHPIDTAKALLTPPKEGEGQMPFSEIAGHAVGTGLVAGAGKLLPPALKAAKRTSQLAKYAMEGASTEPVSPLASSMTKVTGAAGAGIGYKAGGPTGAAIGGAAGAALPLVPSRIRGMVKGVRAGVANEARIAGLAEPDTTPVERAPYPEDVAANARLDAKRAAQQAQDEAPLEKPQYWEDKQANRRLDSLKRMEASWPVEFAPYPEDVAANARLDAKRGAAAAEDAAPVEKPQYPEDAVANQRLKAVRDWEDNGPLERSSQYPEDVAANEKLAAEQAVENARGDAPVEFSPHPEDIAARARAIAEARGGPPPDPGPPLAPPAAPKPAPPPFPAPEPKAGLAPLGAPKAQPPPEPPAIRPPDRSSVPPLSVERTSPSIPVPPPEVTTAPPVPVTVKSGPPAPLQIGRPVPKVQEPPRAPADVVPETTVIGAPAVPDAPVPVPAPDMPVPPAGASEAPVPPARELPSGHRAVPEGDAVLEGVHPDYAELPSPRKAQAKDLRVAEGLAKQGVTVDKLARALDEGDWAKINRWVKSVHPEHRAYDPLKPGSDPAALEARVQKLVNTYRRMPAVAAEAPVVEPVVDAPPPVVEEAPAVTVPKPGRKIGSGKRKKAATSAE